MKKKKEKKEITRVIKVPFSRSINKRENKKNKISRKKKVPNTGGVRVITLIFSEL
jgi:hypothetical protein